MKTRFTTLLVSLAMCVGSAVIAQTITTTPTYLTFDELNTSYTFTVTGTSLTEAINLKAPAGYTVEPSTVAADANGALVTVTFNALAEAKGHIVLTSGTTKAYVRVIGTLNSTTFEPLYPTGNLMTNPYYNGLTDYTGWGTRIITTDTTEVYGGSKTLKMTGSCGGSVDYSLTGKVQANTTYKFKAMAKATGKYKFIVNGCAVQGSNNYYLDINPSAEWQPVVHTFTTGATLAGAQNLYLNSCEGYGGTLLLVDNVELYKMPMVVSKTSLTYIGIGTQDFTVTSQSLTEAITIEAPEGFSVSPATLPADASAAAVSVTFNGGAPASGYVTLTSGVYQETVWVSGTLTPTIVASTNSLSFDELNLVSTFTVNGGNLTSDITITAPEGIVVEPSTIPADNASNVSVTATYNGTTSNLSGNITLTSGTLTENIPVWASLNSNCFEPLYPSGNLIADPYLNSLSAFNGWGNKSVNTDPAKSYCGKNCGQILGVGVCWPNGGSIDAPLTLKPNTKYVVKAMIKTIDGAFQVSIGKSNGPAADINNVIDTHGAWEALTFEFTSGDEVAGAGCYFNNCAAGTTGTTGYIDNWEVYEVPLSTQVGNVPFESTIKAYLANGLVTVSFDLDRQSNVDVALFDARGTLLSKTASNFAAGNNKVTLNANLASGIYIVKITQNGLVNTIKVVK